MFFTTESTGDTEKDFFIKKSKIPSSILSFGRIHKTMDRGSNQENRISETLNMLSGKIIEAAISVHSELGPGLLESIYESALAYELSRDGRLIICINCIESGINACRCGVIIGTGYGRTYTLPSNHGNEMVCSTCFYDIMIQCTHCDEHRERHECIVTERGVGICANCVDEQSADIKEAQEELKGVLESDIDLRKNPNKRKKESVTCVYGKNWGIDTGVDYPLPDNALIPRVRPRPGQITYFHPQQ